MIQQKKKRLPAYLIFGLGALILIYLGMNPGNVKSQVTFGTQVLDRRGELLRITLAADGRYRIWYPLSAYPTQLIQALLVKEDKNYFFHPGVDAFALLRAGYHSLILQDYHSGGSTLTMQLARILFRLDTHTLTGKLNQGFQALRLSLYYSKEDLLELFLNLAPCGGNVEGFGTASRIYYGEDPGKLNISQILSLVVLPQNPAGRNPLNFQNHREIRKARSLLLGEWERAFPTQKDLRERLEAPLDFKKELPFLAPHFTNWALENAGAQVVLPTTLDLRLQQSVERKVSQYLERNRALGLKNAVVMLVKASNMEVLAHVGSGDFYNVQIHGQVDGTAARRSPGSTLKPFIYALALEQGIIHPATVLKDARTHFGSYNPDNFDDDFEGPISAGEALRKSRNIPAVVLAQKIKNPDLYDFLDQSGVDLPYPRSHYGLSIVLGGAEVTMRDLIFLYGALAGEGSTQKLQTSLSSHTQDKIKLFSPETAFLLRRMLIGLQQPDSEDHRTGVAPLVAFKTGTSIGFRDSWSIGVFDGLILGVWVGDFQGGSTTQFVGVKTAAPLMTEIVEALRAGSDLHTYETPLSDLPPKSLVKVRVCSVSGALSSDLCPKTKLTYFVPGISPIEVCSTHQEFPIDIHTGLRRDRFISGVTRREVFEVWPSDILDIFAKAGMIRRVPPVMDPRDGIPSQSFPSRMGILTPINGMTYYLGTQNTEEKIPFTSDADSSAAQVFWFLNGQYEGKSSRGQPLFWTPVPGNHDLKSVDDQGRTASTRFYVRSFQ